MTTPKDSSRRPRTRINGDGSIYQRHSPGCLRPTGPKGDSRCKCTWVGVVTDGYKPDPQRPGKKLPKRTKMSGPTKAIVAAKVRERTGSDGNLPEIGKPITVGEWITYWFKRIAPGEVKPLTLAGYSTKVNHYIIPLLGHHRIDRLTAEHIEDAWQVLRATGNPVIDDPRPLSANTIHQTHRILSHALIVAMQRKRLRANPAGKESMKSPSKVEQEIRPMEEDEVDAVLAACRGTWNAARWSVALALGLRQGEALGLRWEDVDLDTGTLTIRQTLMRISGQGIVFGTPKSAKSRRTVQIPDSLLSSLKSHRKQQAAKRLEVGTHWTDSGLVFTLEDGRPLDPSVDARRWRNLLVKADVKHYRLHDARHSAATMMLTQGVDLRVVMAILGHSQLSVTMRYQHTVDKMLVDAAGKMDQAGRWA